jgi:hypothetical protein
MPDPPGAIGPVARQEARSHLRAERFVIATALAAAASATHRSRPARHRAPRTSNPPARSPGASR